MFSFLQKFLKKPEADENSNALSDSIVSEENIQSSLDNQASSFEPDITLLERVENRFVDDVRDLFPAAVLTAHEEHGLICKSSIEDSLPCLKVPQLKDILQSKGLSTSGKKAALTERILQNFSTEELKSFSIPLYYILTESGKSVVDKYLNSVEYFFKLHSYQLGTSVEEALAIKAKRPQASNPEIAKINILGKQQKYAAEGNWGMYAVTVNELNLVYGMLGYKEEEFESYLQIFYMTLSEGRLYTPLLIKEILAASESCGLAISDIPERYIQAVEMLPHPLVTVPPAEFTERLCNELSELKNHNS